MDDRCDDRCLRAGRLGKGRSVMDRDISRLPKWAQQRIEVLESDVEHWRTKALAGPENSDTFIRSGFHRTPLGMGPSVEFCAGPGLPERVTVRMEGGVLHVQGGDSILVAPMASNAARIVLGRVYG